MKELNEISKCQSTDMTYTNNNIRNLKTVMMISVVLFHACVFYTGNWFTIIQPTKDAGYLALLSDFLNTFQTQAFTMASGYLFFYLRCEKGKYRNTKKDIRKRFMRLIVPYIIISLFWAIPIHVFFYGFKLDELIVKYALGTSPDQLWFLLMLFWCFCFFYFVADRISFTWKYFIAFILISMMGAMLSAIGIISIFQINTSIRYFVFFYLGGFIYHKQGLCNKLKKEKNFILLGISGVVLWIIWELTGNSDFILIKAFHVMEKSLSSIVLVLFVYSIVILLGNKLHFSKNAMKLYEKVSDDSFGIYLFHQQIIFITLAILNGRIHPVFVVLLSFAFAFTISEVIVSMIKKTPLYKILGL